VKTTKQTRKKIMSNKFDQLAKGLAQSVTRRQALKRFGVGLVGLALGGLIAAPVCAQVTHLGPLVELSQPNPLGNCDDGFRFGTFTINDAVEPAIAVNPIQPNNVVASWVFGPFQDLIAGVSFDGGRTWQQAPIPLTLCAGGSQVGGGDPWLSFAPNGDLYALNLAGMDFPSRTAFVNKSSDGGLSWSAPVLVPGTTNTMPDHPTITADPTDSRYAYAAWHSSANKGQNPAVFTRTTNGGQTWETARIIFQTPQNYFVDINQIFVLQDGTLADLFFLYYEPGNKPPKQQTVAVLRSTDKGQSWSGPIQGPTMTPVFQPNGNNFTADPETGTFLKDSGDPAFAIDSRGNLYAVWEDGRFSGFQYNDIAFSMSADGGLTWSTPIRVNQTPLNIPLLNRQAFLPSVAVMADGTIGVSYYDFRFNDPNPGLPTDYWLAQCHPSASIAATNPANWGNEVRLTAASFNLEACVLFSDGEFFLGDYVGGLVASGNGFVADFTAVDQNGVTAIFARRVGR
jgi:hypothetical protein